MLGVSQRQTGAIDEGSTGTDSLFAVMDEEERLTQYDRLH